MTVFAIKHDGRSLRFVQGQDYVSQYHYWKGEHKTTHPDVRTGLKEMAKLYWDKDLSLLEDLERSTAKNAFYIATGRLFRHNYVTDKVTTSLTPNDWAINQIASLLEHGYFPDETGFEPLLQAIQVLKAGYSLAA